MDQTDARLPRSVWQAARDKGPFCPPGSDRVAWAVGQVVRFLERESNFMTGVRALVRGDADVRARLKSLPGLLRRVTQFDPSPPARLGG